MNSELNGILRFFDLNLPITSRDSVARVEDASQHLVLGGVPGHDAHARVLRAPASTSTRPKQVQKPRGSCFRSSDKPWCDRKETESGAKSKSTRRTLGALRKGDAVDDNARARSPSLSPPLKCVVVAPAEYGSQS